MRKNVWKRILAMAAVFCLTLGTVSISAQAEDVAKPSYVALGDSITTGYGLDDPNSAFPSLLAGKMEYELTSLAADGATSADLLEQVQNSAVASADVITITIGGNDLMNALYDYLADAYNEAYRTSMTGDEVKEALTSGDMQMLLFAVQYANGFSGSSAATSALTTFTQNLGSAVAGIKAVNPDALVFVATQYNPYQWLQYIEVNSYSAGTDTSSNPAEVIKTVFEAGVVQLNNVINQVGNQSEGFVNVVDVYGAFKTAYNAEPSSSLCNAVLFPNLDFHPNSEGHGVIADTMKSAIYKTVREILTQAKEAVEQLTLTVDQKDIPSEETAQEWAAGQIQDFPVTRVSVSGSVGDFVAATEGTADNQDGSDGSFEINVTFSLLGLTESAVVPVTIKATAYTAPAQDTENEEDTEDEQVTQAGETNDVNATKVNTPTDKNQTAVPKTGDASQPMIYIALLLAAAVVIVISRKRISRQ